MDERGNAIFCLAQDYTDLDDFPDFYFYDFGRLKRFWEI